MKVDVDASVANIKIKHTWFWLPCRYEDEISKDSNETN